MKTNLRRAVIVMGACLALASGLRADMLGSFPAQVSGATRDGQAQDYDSKTIFDYMDGGADPYLRFAFRRLYVANYKLEGKQAVVEVYDMSSPAEAYGIYSMDLEGRKVAVGQAALYAYGTLRCWKERYFIKVYSGEDSKAFRDFASAVAARLAKSVPKSGSMPALVSTLPASLRPGKFRYFHTSDDLNAVHYVSTENVLELDKSTSVIFANCTYGGKPVKAMVVRYGSAAARDKAWQHFGRKMLSRKAVTAAGGARIEEMSKGSLTGIARYKSRAGEPMLALCFEASSAQSCKAVLSAITAKAQGPR